MCREAAQRRNREFNERFSQPPGGHNEDIRASMYAQVVGTQQRLAELTGNGPSRPAPTTPTVREQKVQEILFDRCQEIPDGLYKELMDALVIRG